MALRIRAVNLRGEVRSQVREIDFDFKEVNCNFYLGHIRNMSLGARLFLTVSLNTLACEDDILSA